VGVAVWVCCENVMAIDLAILGTNRTAKLRVVSCGLALRRFEMM